MLNYWDELFIADGLLKNAVDVQLVCHLLKLGREVVCLDYENRLPNNDLGSVWVQTRLQIVVFN